jgi:hypothetical protein
MNQSTQPDDRHAIDMYVREIVDRAEFLVLEVHVDAMQVLAGDHAARVPLRGRREHVDDLLYGHRRDLESQQIVRGPVGPGVLDPSQNLAHNSFRLPLCGRVAKPGIVPFRPHVNREARTWLASTNLSSCNFLLGFLH